MMPLFLAAAAGYAGLLLWKSATAQRRLRHHSEPPRAPAATVLQAILSGDPSLEATLERNLHTLGAHRFLWLVDEADLEGRRVTERLCARHPLLSIEILLCPPCPEGVNPKLFKLARARVGVATSTVLVLDDDTVLPAASADELLAALTTHGVATGLPCYAPGENAPSVLLAQFVNNNSALTYLGTPGLEPLTLNGMGYALRTSDLDLLPDLLRHLTDDLAVATAIRASGRRIAQTAAPMFLRTEVADFAHYTRQMHRWFFFAALLLREQPVARQALIGFFHGLPPLLLWLALGTALRLRSRLAFSLLGLLLVGRSALLSAWQMRLFGATAHRPLASLGSELLQPVHLGHALLSNRIRWRSRRYQVISNQDFRPDV